MKPFILKRIVNLLALAGLYLFIFKISNGFFDTLFISILDECIRDEYGPDCFSPVIKSSTISFLLAIIVSPSLLFLFRREIRKSLSRYNIPF